MSTRTFADKATIEDIAGWLAMIVAPDSRIELRAPDHPDRAMVRGFDPGKYRQAAALATAWSARAPAVYVVMNAIDPDAIIEGAVKAKDIARRRWLLVDCDPERPADVSSTDAEKQAAWNVAEAVRDYLRSQGWPDPIVADSGNGWHLLYRIDLPARDDDLVKRCLAALATKFDTAEAKVDRKVCDAPRIVKLYGTTARKGKATPDRPHRLARIVEAPDPIGVVGDELLQTLAIVEAPKPTTTRATSTKGSRPSGKRTDRWAAKAVEGECQAILGAPEGGRNDQLNRSSFALGQIVGGGSLDRRTAERSLEAAATDAGLAEGEMVKTIRSGLDAGMKEPRYPAETNGNHGGNGNGNLPAPGNGMPAPIIIITTEEHDVVDQAVIALADDPTIYQRVNMLATVQRGTPPQRKRDILRPPGTPRIVPLPSPRLRERLTKFARWRRYRKNPDGTTELAPAHPPEWAVQAVSARGEWDEIRPIEGVVEAPTIRPDGSVIESPGWDEETGLLYEPNAKFPPIPSRPTRDDARKAAAELLDLVVDFPFADDSHRVAWLAAVLTPLARWAIDGPTPLFLIDANTPGTGKSKLCDLVSIIATGRDMARATYPNREEEMEKQVTAIALAADRMILFDNVATGFSVGGKSLDLALTARTVKGRILGKSEMTQDLPFNAVMFVTGNNLGLRGDALRRVIPCRLDSMEERPEERKGFRYPDLLDHAKRHRGALLAAALTILRAHALHGWPAPELTPMDYPSWCRVVRHAVYWSTGIDPCAARDQLRADDPESNARAALIEGWSLLDGGLYGVSTAEALKQVSGSPEQHRTLHGVFMEWGRKGEMPTASAVSAQLRQIKGRVINGCFLHGKNLSGINLWRVVEVGPGKSDRGVDGVGGVVLETSRVRSEKNNQDSSPPTSAKQHHEPNQPHGGSVVDAPDDPFFGEKF